MLLEALQKVALCQRAGASCKMKEGNLKKKSWRDCVFFFHEIECVQSDTLSQVVGFGRKIDKHFYFISPLFF